MEFKDFKKEKPPLRERGGYRWIEALKKGTGFLKVLLTVGNLSPVPTHGD